MRGQEFEKKAVMLATQKRAGRIQEWERQDRGGGGEPGEEAGKWLLGWVVRGE